MRHPGILPFCFAVALSVAAGLSLAEEHRGAQTGPPAAAPEPPSASAEPLGKGMSRNKGASPGEPEANGSNQAETKPKQGVGSRALTGREAAERAADQPEMATGVDLNGPPVRFPAADTPE